MPEVLHTPAVDIIWYMSPLVWHAGRRPKGAITRQTRRGERTAEEDAAQRGGGRGGKNGKFNSQNYTM
eukprot:3369977-Pyramimonas_sp.AAC.1